MVIKLAILCFLLAMNIIAIKSKVNNVSLLHGLTSNPRHDTHICRNLTSVEIEKRVGFATSSLFHTSS